MAFSFYASLKSLPRELMEASRVYRFGKIQRFLQLELPQGAIGLVWNSMVSVAGGWFFLMACEMFVLGKRDFRLPGLGSYLQSAASAGDTAAIIWGIAAMIGVVVLIDQLVWRPAIAWSDKFKLEQVESSSTPSSPVLNLLRKSPLLVSFARRHHHASHGAHVLIFRATPTRGRQDSALELAKGLHGSGGHYCPAAGCSRSGPRSAGAQRNHARRIF